MFIVVLILLEQHCSGKAPIQFCLDDLGTTLHKYKLCAQKSPDNIALEIILFNFALILLGQHCTGENPVQYCLNTLGKTLHRKKSCSMLS